jgi:predicted transcriptional regulator
MITAAQIRAARALLGWTQDQLADRAIVSKSAVARLERGEVDSRTSTLKAVQDALEAAGVEFLADSGKGVVVRLGTPGRAGSAV